MRHKILALALATLIATAGFTVLKADDDGPPTASEIAFAERTSDLMIQTLVAALLQEVGQTTAAKVEEGNQSISLVFDDKNKSMRLVGTSQPIRDNDRPRDPFEVTAHNMALTGQPYTKVERNEDDRWMYRRSVPLANFDANCAICHSNFGPPANDDWVGAVMLQIPIQTDDDDDDDD